ncbi:unnamed protein product [Mycena citricolor]|uniref:Uncharacterized protein n=1 Tax=Mycena citricolor TaxID=2018698 RepID=A0AAD2JZ90_9AGAR|nr:unnamed protein product [Mycena citricolor]
MPSFLQHRLEPMHQPPPPDVRLVQARERAPRPRCRGAPAAPAAGARHDHRQVVLLLLGGLRARHRLGVARVHRHRDAVRRGRAERGDGVARGQQVDREEGAGGGERLHAELALRRRLRDERHPEQVRLRLRLLLLFLRLVLVLRGHVLDGLARRFILRRHRRHGRQRHRRRRREHLLRRRDPLGQRRRRGPALCVVDARQADLRQRLQQLQARRTHGHGRDIVPLRQRRLGPRVAAAAAVEQERPRRRAHRREQHPVLPRAQVDASVPGPLGPSPRVDRGPPSQSGTVRRHGEREREPGRRGRVGPRRSSHRRRRAKAQPEPGCRCRPHDAPDRRWAGKRDGAPRGGRRDRGDRVELRGSGLGWGRRRGHQTRQVEFEVGESVVAERGDVQRGCVVVVRGAVERFVLARTRAVEHVVFGAGIRRPVVARPSVEVREPRNTHVATYIAPSLTSKSRGKC